MNVERFHSLLISLRDDIERQRIRERFTALVNALTNQSNQPTEPSYQQTVAATRSELRALLQAAEVNEFPPTWVQAIEEMGIGHLLGERLAAEMEQTFAELASTPAAIHEWAQQVSQKQETLWTQITNALAALEYFEVPADTLQPGDFELSLLVPREAVHEHMGELGQEFVNLERIILPFVELATGSRPPLDVKTISSSDFGVILAVGGFAAATIAKAVSEVMDLYLKLLAIKEARAKLKELEVPDEHLAGTEKYVNGVMRSGIDAAAAALVASDAHTSLDPGRRNELEMELKLSMNAIANRIDRGYHIEVRVKPLPLTAGDGDEDEPAASGVDLNRHIETVQITNPKMRFFEPPGTPILELPEADPPAGPTA